MKLLWVIVLLLCSCSSSDSGPGASGQSQAFRIPSTFSGFQKFNLLSESDLELSLSESDLKSAVTRFDKIFGIEISHIRPMLIEALNSIRFQKIHLQLQAANLKINFNEAQILEMTDRTKLSLEQNLVVKNWSVNKDKVYSLETDGLVYGDMTVRSMIYSEDFGLLFSDGVEVVEFDISKVIGFYDEYEEDIEKFMATVENPSIASNGETVSDILGVFEWFKNLAAQTQNKVIIKSDMLSMIKDSTENFDGNNELKPLISGLDRIEITPEQISVFMQDNEELFLELDEQKIRVQPTWSITSEDATALQIRGIDVAQDRWIRDTLWHPLYHVRVGNDQLTFTAWVKPDPLLKARNISTTIDL